MKKVKVLALVMVFAVAALGGAYAMWSDSIYLNETVATGEVNIQWDCLSMSDPAGNYADYNDDVYYEETDGPQLDDSIFDGAEDDPKNIAYKDAELLNDGDTNNGTEGSDEAGLNATQQEDDVLSIELENGYPGYHATVTACISNIGTVPVKIHLSGLDSVPEWLDFVILNAQGQDITDTLEGTQIDPGVKYFVTFDETVLESAPQLTSRTIDLTLEGIQWNAYVAPVAEAE